MTTTEVLPTQQWELTTDNVLFTINEQGKLISFKKGKICKVHGSGETIEAYWLDDIWKPITISKDEFVKYFKKISCTNDMMTTTETDVRSLFPFALDSIFRIKGQVYELLDRSQYWDYKNHRESFKYKMRKFDDEGSWFEVSHEQIISKDYEVVHRALFMRNKRKWMR